MLTEEELGRVIRRYNRYRSPESTAELVSLDDDGFSVEFRGPYFISCCPEEYFEDLRYDLLELTGEEAEIKALKRKSDDSYLVEYKYSR